MDTSEIPCNARFEWVALGISSVPLLILRDEERSELIERVRQVLLTCTMQAHKSQAQVLDTSGPQSSPRAWSRPLVHGIIRPDEWATERERRRD